MTASQCFKGLWESCAPSTPADQSSIWRQTDFFFFFYSADFALLQSQMSKSTFYCPKIREWSYGCAAVMKHSHSWVVEMLKMGSSGRRDSTQWVHAWKVVEADEHGAHRRRPDAITPQRWGPPPPLWLTRDAWLPLYQQDIIKRLFGWPWWPLCGFRFLFEGWFVPSNSLMKKLIQKEPAVSKAHLYCC